MTEIEIHGLRRMLQLARAALDNLRVWGDVRTSAMLVDHTAVFNICREAGLSAEQAGAVIRKIEKLQERETREIRAAQEKLHLLIAPTEVKDNVETYALAARVGVEKP